LAETMRDLLYAKVRLEEVAGMLDPAAHDGGAMGESRVLGVVVEIGLPGDVIMIAGYANGDARLFRESGGGVVGDLYQFQGIADAARALCQVGQSVIGQLKSEGSPPPSPATDMVRVSVLTMEQFYSREVSGPEIVQRGHPLGGVFMASNNLFEELNKLEGQAQSKGQ
jgi:hypothetical protein